MVSLVFHSALRGVGRSGTAAELHAVNFPGMIGFLRASKPIK